MSLLAEKEGGELREPCPSPWNNTGTSQRTCTSNAKNKKSDFIRLIFRKLSSYYSHLFFLKTLKEFSTKESLNFEVNPKTTEIFITVRVQKFY